MAKRKRAVRLKTPTDVRRLLAQTVADIRNDDGSDPDAFKKAETIVKLCNSILRSFETTPILEESKKRSGALAELTKLIGNVAKTITDDPDE